MSTLQNFASDSIPPASTNIIIQPEAKLNSDVTIHLHCSLCGKNRACCRGTINGGILTTAQQPILEPKEMKCFALAGKYFATHPAKIKYHIKLLLTLSGIADEEAERVALLLGDTNVLAEITKTNIVSLYENNAGEKFLTRDEARESSSPGVEVIF